MFGTGEAAHIGADLRNQDLRRTLTNAGNRVQAGKDLLVRYQTLVNFATDALNPTFRSSPMQFEEFL